MSDEPRNVPGTVVFTGLSGSIAFIETHGDLAAGAMFKHYHDIVAQSVQQHSGTLAKSIGDDTLSHFEHALEALRAAAAIQRGMDEYNLAEGHKTPVLARIGLHTGEVSLEHNDIFGDAVNTASRFEHLSSPGEILISEETYNALEDKDEIYCRYIKEVALKGEKDPLRAYKAFWNPKEVEFDRRADATPAPAVKAATPAWKLVLYILVPIVIMAVVTWLASTRGMDVIQEKRSIQHSVTPKPIQ